MVIQLYVDRAIFESEPRALSTAPAWRKRLANNACNVMLCSMVSIMYDPVDARLGHLLARFVFISHKCRLSPAESL